MENITKQSNCITNIWNNLTEQGGGKYSNLSNSGSEQSVKTKDKIKYI